jgi:hypothetical protein
MGPPVVLEDSLLRRLNDEPAGVGRVRAGWSSFPLEDSAWTPVALSSIP